MSFTVTLAATRSHVARLIMPARGLWTSYHELEEPKALAVGARVEVKLGDVTLDGTIVEGGVFAARARYSVVAGRGGWRKVLPRPRSYREGVKLSTVLKDVAIDAGEVWATGFGATFTDRSVGAFARPGNVRAVSVLHQLLDRGWFVSDAGETTLGDRATGRASAEVLDLDLARRIVNLATEKLSKARPGQTLTVGSSSYVLDRVVAETGKRGTALTGYLS